MKKLQIIVPVYLNHVSLYGVIEQCFARIQQHYPSIEVIGVDDASPLPVPSEWPIKLRNEENLGFTATVNKGLAAAEAEVMIVMNDDLFLHEGSLDRFLDLKGKVIASPADTASDDTDKWGAIWGITREAYNELGPLNEAYRNYFSDVDYYERAKEAGINIIKWPDITIDHIESATFKTLDKEQLFNRDLEIYGANSNLSRSDDTSGTEYTG